jgi:hypothetical protein
MTIFEAGLQWEQYLFSRNIKCCLSVSISKLWLDNLILLKATLCCIFVTHNRYFSSSKRYFTSLWNCNLLYPETVKMFTKHRTSPTPWYIQTYWKPCIYRSASTFNRPTNSAKTLVKCMSKTLSIMIPIVPRVSYIHDRRQRYITQSYNSNMDEWSLQLTDLIQSQIRSMCSNALSLSMLSEAGDTSSHR